MEQFTANKKPLFESDIDPKRIKSVADGLRRQGEFESARMLDGYADILEAREKAVPVKIDFDARDSFTVPIDTTTLQRNTRTGNPSDAERLAEALGEGDFAAVAQWKEWIEEGKRAYLKQESAPGHLPRIQESINFSIAYALRKLRATPAAHSARTPWTDGEKAHFKAAAELVAQREAAQAQPPAASVTDAMVNAAMRADFCGHNVADALMCGTDWTTEVMRAALAAALAAQENPNG